LDLKAQGIFGSHIDLYKIFLIVRNSDQKTLVLKRNFRKCVKDKYYTNKFMNLSLGNVVQIFDWFYDKEEFCIIMELCNNGSLYDFINIHAKNNDFIDESVFFLIV
jgi:serine/threonine protein kinase